MAKTAEPNTTPAPDGRPLVARTSPLENRWGRLSIVFGQDGVELLAGKKVLLFGLGGVGLSPSRAAVSDRLCWSIATLCSPRT